MEARRESEQEIELCVDQIPLIEGRASIVVPGEARERAGLLGGVVEHARTAE